MKKNILIISAALMALPLATSSAQESAVPSGMTYQGRLTDSNNSPVPDGTGYELEVRIWSASTGGTLLWGARYTGVSLKGGAFNLILGTGGTPIAGASTTDLKTSFNTAPVFLGVTTTKSATGSAIPSPAEILPRQQIFSTPYSFRSEKSEDSSKLGGQPATYYSPTGSIVAFAGQAAPQGWLLCDGTSISATAYPSLFAVLGTRFGSDAAGTFKLPNLAGRFPLGANPAAVTSPPISVRSLAQQGGEENHTLTIAEMPSHGHDERYSTSQSTSYTGAYVSGYNYAASAPRAIRIDTFDTQSPLPIAPTGGGAAHNTMPPFLVLNYIIKY